ncbi:MAG: AAA family ATPase [Chitinophagaceae bacterium]|nr:AAA family ATPase [Chitinophagaceae bacterium]
MKRITSIQLENFRAFYKSYEPIVLPNGENLLLYGENGSGKSSLFKALKTYFQSSRNAAGFPFELNSYVTTPLPIQGNVQINFVDVNPVTRQIVAGSNQLLTFSNNVSNHNVQFVQDADLVKGFLDYRNLLSVYFHKEANPNLFNLIVLEILGAHIPAAGNYNFANKWQTLNENLIDNAYTRNDRSHQNALADLPTYQANLNQTLSSVFNELNRLLNTYYPDLRIQLGFILQPLTFIYGNGKWEWHTTADLRLQVVKDGNLIHGDYSEVLNEARLSAFAVCLYLASLRTNPSNFDLKLLFLDDVFIGIDASNRKPILEILRNEFNDYQIFITTYDKYWYELAQRHFNSFMPGKWSYDNLYVGTETDGAITFDKPILVQNDNEYSKAIYYLHHPHKPDYPAAANYFRKYAESILSNELNIPSHEIRNEDYSLIENYKLTNLVNSALHFVRKIRANDALLVILKNALHTLLHPLSHFNLTSPVYKVELIEIQKCLELLEPYLKSLVPNYRLFIPHSKMFKLRFIINATDTGYYEIFPKEAIYLLNDAGTITLSEGECHCKTCYTLQGINEISRYNFNNTNPVAQYLSVANSYDVVYNHLHGQAAYSHIPRALNYSTEFELNDGTNWQPLNTLMVW